ncbi:MAG: SURF1 family protein [Gammaproteobacteria bacterium]|nr:SURF1 family protein [Gammaproteobacteria bacterium]
MKTFTRSVIEMMIFVLAVLLLVQLGLWQLKREQQKKLILSAYEHNQTMNVRQDLNDIQPFSRVKLEGKAQLPILYLDNQFYQHQFGYHVLCVLHASEGKYVLADLGWIKGDINRITYPFTELPLRRIWQGYAYHASKKPMSLGQWLEHEGSASLVIESLDLEAIEAYLKIKLVPWVLRVNESPIYKPNWPLVSVPPSRHRAYALQWFSMAAILCLIFLWRMMKR